MDIDTALVGSKHVVEFADITVEETDAAAGGSMSDFIFFDGAVYAKSRPADGGAFDAFETYPVVAERIFGIVGFVSFVSIGIGPGGIELLKCYEPFSGGGIASGLAEPDSIGSHQQITEIDAHKEPFAIDNTMKRTLYHLEIDAGRDFSFIFNVIDTHYKLIRYVIFFLNRTQTFSFS